MAGYRIGAADRPVQLPEGEAAAPGRLLRADPCYDLMGISEDFQDVIRAACPRCRGGDGVCIAQQLQALAAGLAPG
jgi:hypothetical protein